MKSEETLGLGFSLRFRCKEVRKALQTRHFRGSRICRYLPSNSAKFGFGNLTRKVIHLRELRLTEILDFTWVLRFCISQKLACFALNFALISSFVKIVGLTYKKFNIRTGIEVVITALTRNAFALTGTWVQISPSPPKGNRTVELFSLNGAVFRLLIVS